MVEPLIKDPPRKGQPLYKGHFRKEDSLPKRDKMAGPKASFTRRGSTVHAHVHLSTHYSNHTHHT